jgi:hypothetical protein
MNKLALIAVGIASVAANYNMTWSPFDQAAPNAYYNLNVACDADVYYRTNYGADGQSENYGFEFTSYANLTVEMEFF